MTNFKEIDAARKVLKLGESATLQEIRNAYRKLVLEYHPDRSESKNKKDSEEMFKKITAAYDIIMAYCATYRYSFKKEVVQDTIDIEIDKKLFKNFYDGWIVNFEKEDNE